MTINEKTVQDALEMLRDYYRMCDTTPMRASGLGNLTPAAAVTQFLAAPDVLTHLARTLNACVAAD